MEVRVARGQCNLVVHVRDEDAAVIRRHDLWDAAMVDSTLVLSPGGASSTHLHWQNMPGEMHAMTFARLAMLSDIPFFGIVEALAQPDDDESLRILLDPCHKLPWIKPFRAGCWPREQISEFIMQRVRSALKHGSDRRTVLQDIRVPDIMRDVMDETQWHEIIDAVRQSGSSSMSASHGSTYSPMSPS